jgi:hypothetical protein
METLKYRFCPRCGAEIPTEPQKLDDAMLTIPPDLSEPQSEDTADVLSPPAHENISTTSSFNDQTMEPQPVVKRSRPKIKPPDTPPPTSFFRSGPEKKEPPLPDIKQQPPAKSPKKAIIVILILLVVFILIMGGIFTF